MVACEISLGFDKALTRCYRLDRGHFLRTIAGGISGEEIGGPADATIAARVQEVPTLRRERLSITRRLPLAP